MSAKFVYKTYKIQGNADLIREKLIDILLDKGYIRKWNLKTTENSDTVMYFKYPSLLFSTKNPLTCISCLSLDVIDGKDGIILKIGVTFTKIKYFTIFIMLLFCVIIPSVLGIIQHGIPDVPPMAVIGLPLGFMVYYHVRSRVFRALGRLIKSIED